MAAIDYEPENLYCTCDWGYGCRFHPEEIVTQA